MMNSTYLQRKFFVILVGYFMIFFINIDLLNAQIINTCSSSFYDTGGPNGDYTSNENYTTTYCSDNGGNIRALFKSFSTSSLGNATDTLFVFDGVSTFSNLIGKYYGSIDEVDELFTPISLIRATGNCLTFRFQSGSMSSNSGWEADIYCLQPPMGSAEICGDGIDNDGDGLIDAVDPDCGILSINETCGQEYSYYLPPIWQVHASTPEEMADYLQPAILHFSTYFANANFNVRTIDGSFSESFSITSTTPKTEMIVSDFLQSREQNQIQRNKGFIVTSDVPLQIKYLLDGEFNKNLLTYKGNEGLGKGFRVASQANTIVAGTRTKRLKESHFISVMATEDSTHIIFEFDVPMSGISSPHEIVLNRGETYLIKENDLNVTVSGALVTSDKDISVVSGSQHTPAYGVYGKDGAVDHLVPVSKAGTDYVVCKGNLSNNQDYVIVVPIENGTNIYINGSAAPVASIHASDFFKYDLDGSRGAPTYFRTSKPSMVYHISGLGNEEVGMAIVPPIDICSGSKKAMFSKFAPKDDVYFNLIIPNEGLGSLRLNGINYNGIPTMIPGFSGYSSLLISNEELLQDNLIESDYYFTGSIVMGNLGYNAGYGFITPFSQGVDFLDPNTDEPITFIQLDTICKGATIDYTFNVSSCGSDHKLISAYNNSQVGIISIIDSAGLVLQYQALENRGGNDTITAIVENEDGMQSTVCLSVFVSDLFLDLGRDLGLCSDGTVPIRISDLRGGERPYTFLWSTGENTNSITVDPIISTSYSLTVTDMFGCSVVDSVIVQIGEHRQLVCRSTLNISLDDECAFTVPPHILLSDSIFQNDTFHIELKDKFEQIIPNGIITKSQIGQFVSYSIADICGNMCWGTLFVEDKINPTITCTSYEKLCGQDYRPESVGFPFPIVNPIQIGNNAYKVSGIDPCGDVTVNFNDHKVDLECSDLYEQIIYRNWTITDASGNKANCQDTINIIKEHINNIIFPLNRDDIEAPSLVCDGHWSKLENGYPAIDSLAGGSPNIKGCKFLQATFEDSFFPYCGNSYKIFRHWVIYDWCTGQSREDYQMIIVTDNQAPSFICPQDFTINTQVEECNSGMFLIATPEILDNCNNSRFTVEIALDKDTTFFYRVDTNNVIVDVPLGEHFIRYTAEDDCGNKSSCRGIIAVVDKKAPFVVAEKHTVVSIPAEGSVRVFSETFDDGSFDNCGVKLMKVRKEIDSCGFEVGVYSYHGHLYNDYVEFCCSEVGNTIKVELLVEDIHGNVNSAWVEVRVEDKIFPKLIAPPNITISCTNDIDLDSLQQYGRIAIGDEERNHIFIYDTYNNGSVGLDGYAVDNCSIGLSEVVDSDLHCGNGEIRRTFTIKDSRGMTDSKVQIITFQNPDTFGWTDIIWPENKIVIGCLGEELDPAIMGEPIYKNEYCTTIVTTYEDKIFTIGDSSCVVVYREWQVTDWCRYNPIDELGFWKYVQVLDIESNIAPIFDSNISFQDTTVCIFGSCEGLVELKVHATDDCEEDVLYKWQVDFDLDGFYDDEGKGEILSEIWEPGRYLLAWTAQDWCGNFKVEKYYVTVVDCKPPTPYCLSDVSTVVMPSNGHVTIWASDFDFGSFDNCTMEEDLILSFFKDSIVTNFTISCEMIENGRAQSIPLEIWVTDNDGNQDFCSVNVNVQDNSDACLDSEILNSTDISGKITIHNSDAPMKDVKVNLESELNDLKSSILTNDGGGYEFKKLPLYGQYQFRPEYDKDILKGVSTLDLIYIQKHILGLKVIENPYFLIAADINKSGSITGTDLVILRKSILGVYNRFPNNKSWRFIDKSFVFEDNEKPWNFIEEISVNTILDNYKNVDFMGIKIGDVNGSYYSKQYDFSERDLIERLKIITDSKKLQKGEIVKVKIALSESIQIEGLQLALGYNSENIELLNVKSTVLNLREEHVNFNGDKEGEILISYDNIEGVTLVEKVNFLELEFIPKQNCNLESNLWLNGKEIKAELYSISDGTKDLELEFKSRIVEEYVSTNILYPNEPNPFVSNTRIKFEISEAQRVVIQIIDLSGKIIYEVEQNCDAGLNYVDIEKSNLRSSGVYYYQMIAKDFQASRKMILTE